VMSGSGGSGGNSPPVAVDDSGGMGDAVLGRLYHVPNQSSPNILANDYDPDPGDTVTFSQVVQAPDHGVLTMGPMSDGTFEYTPQKIGTELFTYKATDGMDESNAAWVRYNVVAPVVDVDSDNTGTIDQTPEEDEVEADP
jgi:hypothetical protein